MKSIILVFLLIISFSFSSSLLAGQVFLGVDGGRSNIDVNLEFRPAPSSDKTQIGKAFNAIAGYKFNNNIILASSESLYDGNNFLGAEDRVHVRSYGVVVGYSWDLAKRFRVIPMIGVDIWNLESKGGALESREKTRSYDGTDNYLRVNFNIPLNDLVALSLSITHGTYEFGTLNSQRIGVNFTF